jgi:hypothetical protein
MARLGCDRYVARGGDWGSAVTRDGPLETEHCIAMHTNMPLLSPGEALTKDLTEQEVSVRRFPALLGLDSGYSSRARARRRSATASSIRQPRSAWILEFWSWTDCGGHPENALTRDEILDNVMLCWLPGAAASSARLYWESFRFCSSRSRRSTCRWAPASSHEIFDREALVRGATDASLQHARGGGVCGVRAAGVLTAKRILPFRKAGEGRLTRIFWVLFGIRPRPSRVDHLGAARRAPRWGPEGPVGRWLIIVVPPILLGVPLALFLFGKSDRSKQSAILVSFLPLLQAVLDPLYDAYEDYRVKRFVEGDSTFTKPAERRLTHACELMTPNS